MQKTVLLVCGGMHPPSYTGQVLATIDRCGDLHQQVRVVTSPQHSVGVLSAFALRQTLEATLDPTAPPPRLMIWAFSAGCVGAAALAAYWQRWRSPVLALLMVDGWGVLNPLGVPVSRLSHDRFTHDTTGGRSTDQAHFYADPAVPHLHLWQQPQTVTGWAVGGDRPRQKLTAADFLLGRSLAALQPDGHHPGLNINGP